MFTVYLAMREKCRETPSQLADTADARYLCFNQLGISKSGRIEKLERRSFPLRCLRGLFADSFGYYHYKHWAIPRATIATGLTLTGPPNSQLNSVGKDCAQADEGAPRSWTGMKLWKLIGHICPILLHLELVCRAIVKDKVEYVMYST